MKTRSFKIYRAIVNEIAMAKSDKVLSLVTGVKMVYQRKCVICNKSFLKKRSNQLTCSKNCDQFVIDTQRQQMAMNSLQTNWNKLKELINYKEDSK
jgi:predicted nucleic acid-binding Zn ribbon protein